MKKIVFSFFLLAGVCLAQNGQRIGDSLPTWTTAAINGTTVFIPVASANIQVCNYPANATPCTNKATTYTDSTLVTPCSTSSQVVLAGTSSCVAAADSLGNWGAWVPAGLYAFTFTSSAGSFGPYPIGAGLNAALSAITNPTANEFLNMSTFNFGMMWPGTTSGTMLGLGMPNKTSATILANAPFKFVADQGGGANGGGTTLVLDGNGGNGHVSISVAIAQDGSTQQYQVVKAVGANGVGLALTTDAGIGYKAVGICVIGCGGTPGLFADIAVLGIAPCVFDGGAPAAGDLVAISSTVNGNCHDSGILSSASTTAVYIGRVYSNQAYGTNIYPVLVQIP